MVNVSSEMFLKHKILYVYMVRLRRKLRLILLT